MFPTAGPAYEAWACVCASLRTLFFFFHSFAVPVWPFAGIILCCIKSLNSGEARRCAALAARVETYIHIYMCKERGSVTMHHRESIIQEDIESRSTRLESKAIGVSSVSVCVCVFLAAARPLEACRYVLKKKKKKKKG